MPRDPIAKRRGREIIYEAAGLLKHPFEDIRHGHYRHTDGAKILIIPHPDMSSRSIYVSVTFSSYPSTPVDWEGLMLHFLYEGEDSRSSLDMHGHANTRVVGIPDERVDYSLYLATKRGIRVSR